MHAVITFKAICLALWRSGLNVVTIIVGTLTAIGLWLWFLVVEPAKYIVDTYWNGPITARSELTVGGRYMVVGLGLFTLWVAILSWIWEARKKYANAKKDVQRAHEEKIRTKERSAEKGTLSEVEVQGGEVSNAN